jgi:outer membrane protein OmpA-like peptidoglycan-associated protein
MKNVLFFLLMLVSHLLVSQNKYDKTKLVKNIVFNFETNKSNVNAEEAINLDQELSSLGDLNGYYFLISGHTDAVGNKQSNLRLSNLRAKEIEKIIKTKGVLNENIDLSFYGADQPKADNTTDEGKRSNRRTELSIYSKKNEELSSQNTLLSGIVKSAKSGVVKGAKIVFSNANNAVSTTTNLEGKYSISLPSNTKYGVSASLEKHFVYNNEVNLNERSQQFDLTFLPLEENQTVSLNSITFYNNKAVLQEKSKPVLSKILEQLKVETNICFEIQGHVNAPTLDIKSKDVYTSDLSLARALSIYDYFSNNGIAKDRMYSVGYGHTKMIYPKAMKTEEHLANMRVDIKTVNCSDAKTVIAREDKLNATRLRNSVYFK